MSIEFLQEHTKRIPVDSPLRQQFEQALAEVEELKAKVEDTSVKDSTPAETKKTKKSTPPTAA